MKTLDMDSLCLLSGSHEPNDNNEMCVMEAVAFVAGEPWSDSPQCASPVIAAFMRAYNDSVSDEVRQTLKPYITRLVGTRASEEVEKLRALAAADWLVRVHTPAWLRLAGLNLQAESLESLPEITCMAHIPSIKPVIEVARIDAAAAWDAARDAAWDAARAAAWAAARAAARDAAGDAARAAAWDAARDAAWDAARAAARDAAWDAARAAARAAARDAAWDAARAAAGDAARDALKPTVDALQTTIPALIEKMLSITEAAFADADRKELEASK